MSVFLWISGTLAIAIGFVATGVSGMSYVKDDGLSGGFGRVGAVFIVLGALCWRYA